MIDGVDFVERTTEGLWVFSVDSFSDELEEKIRRYLSSVCHGSTADVTDLPVYEYRATLQAFLSRYKSKDRNGKVGLIGELLTNLFIREYLPDFQIASPYFNQETKGVRNGFDIINFESGSSELWITEIKSGEKNDSQSCQEKSSELARTAQGDLLSRLNRDDSSSLWYNALTSARGALDGVSGKAAIMSIISDLHQEAAQKNLASEDCNVILVAVLFNHTRPHISADDAHATFENLQHNRFKKVIFTSLQKDTYQRIEEFLESEST